MPAYSPEECVEEEFSELRLWGVLRSSRRGGPAVLLRLFEDQPRPFEARRYRLASLAGDHAHEPVALASEVLQGLDHLFAVQHENDPMLLRQILYGGAPVLFR